MYFHGIVHRQNFAYCTSQIHFYLEQSGHKQLAWLDMTLKCHVANRMILQSQTSARKLVIVTPVLKLQEVFFPTGAFPLCSSKDVLREDVGRERKLFTHSDLCEAGEKERAVWSN